jgi:hypothetical protein
MIGVDRCKYWSGREDLNLRPPGPSPGEPPNKNISWAPLYKAEPSAGWLYSGNNAFHRTISKLYLLIKFPPRQNGWHLPSGPWFAVSVLKPLGT